jgi:hypothetical protein
MGTLSRTWRHEPANGLYFVWVRPCVKSVYSRCGVRGISEGEGSNGATERSRNANMALALGFLLPNGCLQQIAANRFSIPQDVIAILLQGFVRRALSWMISHEEEGDSIRSSRSSAATHLCFCRKRSGSTHP